MVCLFDDESGVRVKLFFSVLSSVYSPHAGTAMRAKAEREKRVCSVRRCALNVLRHPKEHK